jgi:uncharacterized membrane-anchored protein
MSKEPIRVDESVYRTARSTRPSWANALIVASVIFIAWIVVSVLSGFGTSVVLLIAAVVTAVIAGVMALTSVQRSKGQDRS